MSSNISGDVINKFRLAQGDIKIEQGDRGGVSFRSTHIPLDFYLSKAILSHEEHNAGSRLFRDFYISGQTQNMTSNFNSIRSSDKRHYLPVNDAQREALDRWRKAIDSVPGKIGQLMVLNVCCYGYWLNDVAWVPYKKRDAMPRFKEALAALDEFYHKEI